MSTERFEPMRVETPADVVGNIKREREFMIVLGLAQSNKPCDVEGGITIDVFKELCDARARVRVLELAARTMIEAQDLVVRADGSVFCLRYVNTAALKLLHDALTGRIGT